MQFMWVSGPTGTVRSISITARKVIMATAGLSVALMLVGFVMYFVGFRIAVEFSPDLARSMGGVTTEAEQQRINAGATFAATLIRLRGGTWRAVLTVEQLATWMREAIEPEKEK